MDKVTEPLATESQLTNTPLTETQVRESQLLIQMTQSLSTDTASGSQATES
jgi:hypothetical protein